jgi:hypothetical protein
MLMAGVRSTRLRTAMVVLRNSHSNRPTTLNSAARRALEPDYRTSGPPRQPHASVRSLRQCATGSASDGVVRSAPPFATSWPSSRSGARGVTGRPACSAAHPLSPFAITRRRVVRAARTRWSCPMREIEPQTIPIPAPLSLLCPSILIINHVCVQHSGRRFRRRSGQRGVWRCRCRRPCPSNTGGSARRHARRSPRVWKNLGRRSATFSSISCSHSTSPSWCV